MKNMPIRIITAALCIGLLVTACETEAEEEVKDQYLAIENGSFYDISNVKWKDNIITTSNGNLRIPANGNGDARVQNGSDYLYFTRDGTVAMTLRTADAIPVNGTTRFTLTNATMVVDTTQETNKGALSAITPTAPASSTALTIKNQSFSELQNVQWQGVTFASNAVENSVPVGNTVTKEVDPGSGYIFFKRKSNPAFARTKEVVTVGENGTEEFVFTDNTLIVEANNPDNTGTLKDMTTTVVFFDDAEGEIQNYAERKGSAYYSNSSELPYYRYNYTSFYGPYTGTGKSIALGGLTDAKLRLTLNLEREAKLSFWYANIDYGTLTEGAVFAIDETQKAEWQGNYNWSFQEYTLEAGPHEIVWTKHGYYEGYYSYLSLDNILVYYTE